MELRQLLERVLVSSAVHGRSLSSVLLALVVLTASLLLPARPASAQGVCTPNSSTTPTRCVGIQTTERSFREYTDLPFGRHVAAPPYRSLAAYGAAINAALGNFCYLNVDPPTLGTGTLGPGYDSGIAVVQYWQFKIRIGSGGTCWVEDSGNTARASVKPVLSRGLFQGERRHHCSLRVLECRMHGTAAHSRRCVRRKSLQRHHRQKNSARNGLFGFGRFSSHLLTRT